MLGVIKITHSLHVSTQGDLFGNGKPVEWSILGIVEVEIFCPITPHLHFGMAKHPIQTTFGMISRISVSMPNGARFVIVRPVWFLILQTRRLVRFHNRERNTLQNDFSSIKYW
jgi:hypothetical protein